MCAGVQLPLSALMQLTPSCLTDSRESFKATIDWLNLAYNANPKIMVCLLANKADDVEK
jgi:hypothetical protein